MTSKIITYTLLAVCALFVETSLEAATLSLDPSHKLSMKERRTLTKELKAGSPLSATEKNGVYVLNVGDKGNNSVAVAASLRQLMEANPGKAALASDVESWIRGQQGDLSRLSSAELAAWRTALETSYATQLNMDANSLSKHPKLTLFLYANRIPEKMSLYGHELDATGSSPSFEISGVRIPWDFVADSVDVSDSGLMKGWEYTTNGFLNQKNGQMLRMSNKAEAERKRVEQERLAAKEAAAKKAEAHRIAEEARLAKIETDRIAEEARLAKIEADKAEEARLAEKTAAAKKAEADRLAASQKNEDSLGQQNRTETHTDNYSQNLIDADPIDAIDVDVDIGPIDQPVSVDILLDACDVLSAVYDEMHAYLKAKPRYSDDYLIIKPQLRKELRQWIYNMYGSALYQLREQGVSLDEDVLGYEVIVTHHAKRTSNADYTLDDFDASINEHLVDLLSGFVYSDPDCPNMDKYLEILEWLEDTSTATYVLDEATILAESDDEIAAAKQRIWEAKLQKKVAEEECQILVSLHTMLHNIASDDNANETIVQWRAFPKTRAYDTIYEISAAVYREHARQIAGETLHHLKIFTNYWKSLTKSKEAPYEDGILSDVKLTRSSKLGFVYGPHKIKGPVTEDMLAALVNAIDTLYDEDDEECDTTRLTEVKQWLEEAAAMTKMLEDRNSV